MTRLLLVALLTACQAFELGRRPRGGGRLFGLGKRPPALGRSRPPLAEAPPLFATVENYKAHLEAGSADEAGVEAAPPKHAVVVGAGPTGLATAILLAKRGWQNVTVYDRLAPPPPPGDAEAWGDAERSYNIGINGRGQKALGMLGAMDRVASYAVPVYGRFDWSPEAPDGQERVYNKTYTSRIIQRERLTSALLEECNEVYADQITVLHEFECAAMERPDAGYGWDLEMRRRGGDEGGEDEVREVSADFVVGADGVKSTVRETLEAKGLLKHRRFPESNTRVYRTIRLNLPSNWRKDLNYSHRGASGITIDALPTKEGLYIAVVLFRPNDPRVDELKTVEDAKKLFQSEFPQLAEIISDEDYAAFVAKKTMQLPGFSYAGGSLRDGGDAVVLGDAIHTVKPYFGMGANSAFEDVAVLGRYLDEHGDAVRDLPAALTSFSDDRAGEAKALVRMSRFLDGGFLTFILPIILDSVCNKFAPWLCAPNTIQMLQKENLRFTQVARRKRMDRALQAVVGAGLLAVAAKGAYLAARGLWRMRGAVGLA
uniref:FAD-binding domain-containing protein n=1 Tax=Phaeomonas parva TaxID=124430 RepID=A0A6U4L0R6_9STRA|mmetsp:Transcript_5100/g.14451  ORF Transcript_5100/g.14451 Transcript_5100/m.14451 type:complete len:543 (+) Transcript_5100:203-1831(+)